MYQSCAGATMMIGNQVMGILKLYATKEKRIFTSLELEHLQLIANQLVNSIENNRLFEQNEKQKEILVKQIIARKKIEEEIKQNAEKLRQLDGLDTRRARFIALTGYGQAADKARALAAGFDAQIGRAHV